MINHIDVSSMLRKSVCELYSNLVTRPTGAAVRSEIEQELDRIGDRALTVIDFSHVGLLDFSCADEIVAKLLRDRFAVLVLSGITDGHREAIEPVLSGHGLAALIERADGTLESLGAAAAAAALLDELVARRLAAPLPGGTYALTLA